MCGKKIISFLLIFMMIIAAGGCQNKKTSEGKVSGRYLESEVALPKLDSKEKILNMESDSQGRPTIYTYRKIAEDKVSVDAYHYKNDGEYEKEEIPWLNNLDLSVIYNGKVMQGEDGSIALYCEMYHKKSFDRVLYVEANGKAKKINIQDWNAKNSGKELYGSDVISYVNKEKVIYIGQDQISEYDLTSEKKLESTEYLNAEGCKLVYGSGKLIVIGGEYDDLAENSIKVDILQEDDLSKAAVSMPFETTGSKATVGYVNSNGDIILANGDGIHVLEKNATIWQTVVDGSLNQMYAQNSYCYNVIQTKQNEYYVLYQSMANLSSDKKCGYQLMKYTWDDSIAAVPEQTLSIYTLNEKEILQDAALILQRKHPKVKVNIIVGMSDEVAGEDATGETEDDCIRILSTQLLSHQGADLIVTDGLPYESYVKKGALEDISDVIQPMIKDGQILENIVQPFAEGNTYYTVPVGFNLPMIFVKPEAANIASSLADLSGATKKFGEKKVLGPTTYDDLLQEFLPEYNSLLLKDGQLDKEALKECLEQINQLYVNSGSIREYKEGWKPDIIDLPKDSLASIQETYGFNSMVIDLGVMNEIGGSYQIMNDSFLPHCRISVNESSKQKDIAKEFIQILLSEEIQSIDYFHEGYPVNVKALEAKKEVDGSELGFFSYVEMENGQSKLVSFSWPTKEEINRIIKECKSVSHCVVEDREIVSIITEQSKDYFEGTITSDQAVERIESKIHTYLME